MKTIAPYVDEFIEFARKHPKQKFLVTEIGCGIAGFTVEEIAPLFKQAMTVKNIHLPERFWKMLTSNVASGSIFTGMKLFLRSLFHMGRWLADPFNASGDDQYYVGLCAPPRGQIWM